MYAFIVGSPRSGTTLLANLLGRHPAIGIRYEPYYVWERYFWDRPDDVLTANDAAENVSHFIAGSFDRYKKKTGYQVLVDKSPRSSLRIPFINKVFPGAKWIHIVRDGRDATLSIYKRWGLMDEIAVDNSLSKSGWAYLADRLSYEPFWIDKFRFLRHEARPVLKYRQLLSRLRWGGKTGWGPRFKGYQRELQRFSRLEFCASQWLACINAVQADIKACGINDMLTVSYEDLIQDGPGTLTALLTFLGCRFADGNYNDIALNAGNTGKWQNAFSEEQQRELQSILMPKLQELGYA